MPKMKKMKVGGAVRSGPGASMAAAKASEPRSSKMWRALDKAAESIGWNQDVARSKLNIKKYDAATKKSLKKMKEGKKK